MKQIDRIRNMKKSELLKMALRQPCCMNCLATDFCDKASGEMRCADIWQAYLESEVEDNEQKEMAKR